MTDTKRCPACKKSLPRTTGPSGHWTISKSRGDGLEGQCKACKREANGRTRDKARAKNADPLAFDIDVDEAARIEIMRPYSREERLRALEEPAATKPPPDDFEALRRAVGQGLDFGAVCDRLRLTPRECRELIIRASAAGATIRVDHNRVSYRPDEPVAEVQESDVPPVVGRPTRVAAMSDLHIGSRYCLYGPMNEFVDYAYSTGVRAILLGGDLVDGNYVKHGLHELTHVGLDNQAELLARRLPQREGLTYHGILGNHDLTFEADNGVSVTRTFEHAFARAGRKDLNLYGNRGAFIRIGGVVVHLWHPGKGGAYAVSYPLQKKVESYSPGEKPGILIAGHWHKYCHILDRGVHALACPTFQGGGSAFSKSLVGTVAIGGLILEWELTEAGTIRSFRHEVRQYFQRERPVEI